jgi:hypothetical protein
VSKRNDALYDSRTLMNQASIEEQQGGAQRKRFIRRKTLSVRHAGVLPDQKETAVWNRTWCASSPYHGVHWYPKLPTLKDTSYVDVLIGRSVEVLICWSVEVFVLMSWCVWRGGCVRERSRADKATKRTKKTTTTTTTGYGSPRWHKYQNLLKTWFSRENPAKMSSKPGFC